MFDVVTVGSNVVDVFVDTNIHEKKKALNYPVGSKLLIKDIRFDIGGGGTNTGVAFARLGLRTGYAGKVGKDNNGKEILALLRNEKVKFLGKQEGKSDVSIILDSKEHGRTVLTKKVLNNTLRLKNVKKFKTKWLYYSTMMGESFETQLELARKTKAKIAFNPTEYLIKRVNLKPLLKHVKILILNKEESKMLANNVEKLRELGPEIICITDKDKEIQCYNGIKNYKIKPHKIKVVERTGAGDAFAATLVGCIIKGVSMNKSLELAVKNSESVIRHIGAKNKLLRWRNGWLR
ncbi:carbohydrate kinase family protein [Candidatus Pacearchaeota archaeon]|jgi:ribokinase|nr:carbohydrate kinase family protein [Candidatus Pacearchaeota archaeon]|tara:strand:- start:16332 stop:17207 length:876 start_codon:yes stop_codon:yes gene_type:complete